MFQAIDVSTSGLVAQRIRLNTVAMNIANAEAVDSPEGGPYQRRQVLFATGQDSRDKTGQGVHVAAVEKEKAFRFEYDPSHPYANQNGYVKLPDINPLIEMANGMEASRAYEANITAIELSKSMLNSSLRLLA